MGIGFSEPDEPDASILTGASEGQQFGDYQLLEEVGRGGMGVVYRARQISLNRIVAVKMLVARPFAVPELEERLHLEAEAAAGLNHPNIVTVYDFGECDNQFYFSMEYVEGRSLAQLTRHHSLAPKQAAQHLKTVAEAVHHAHEHGILHRDLKPSNILIDLHDQVKVTDFGLAKRLGTDSELTLTGQLVGSPNYLSPEQAAGKHQSLTARSDVYSLGAVLYQLLTARPPLVGESLQETLLQIREKEAPSPRLLTSGVPRDLETICLKCLQKEPGRRYESAQALAEDLGRFLEGKPILARPVSTAGRVGRWCRRKPALAGALAGCALALLLGVIGITWQWKRAETEARVAQRNLYGADMLLVQQALEQNDLGRAKKLLDRHRPSRESQSAKRNAQIGVDFRGWEWRYLWSQCQSDEKALLLPGTNAVLALAFVAEGKQLAIRHPGDVMLWDVQTRRIIWEQSASSGARALAASPDGKLLAWGTRETNGTPSAVLWDLASQREVARLPHDADVVSLAFSPDLCWLAALTRRTEVLVWSVGLRQVEARLAARAVVPIGAGSDFGRVLFSPTDRLLAVGTHRQPSQLVDWVSGTAKDIASFKLNEGTTALAFTPDGKRLAMGLGYFDNSIYLYDVATGASNRLDGHRGWIACLAFSANGQWLASASADQTIRLWDASSGLQKAQLQGHEGVVTTVAWTADSRQLVSGSSDGTVRLWNAETNLENSPRAVLPEQTRDLASAPGGKGFVTLRWDPAFHVGSQGPETQRPTERCVIFRDWRTLEEISRFTSLGATWVLVAMSEDGRRLALGDWRGHVNVWDVERHQPITNLVVGSGWIGQLQFSRTGDGLVCRDDGVDGRHMVRVYNTASWAPIALPGLRLEGIEGAVLSPTGRILAVAYQDGTVAWWDLDAKQRRALFDWRQDLGGANEMAFSPDGRWFATCGLSRGLVLVEVRNRRTRSIAGARLATANVPVAPFADSPTRSIVGTHLATACSLSFSPDGQRLITSGPAGVDSLKLWDVESGREVATLTVQPGFYERVGFSPDGETLFVVSRWLRTVSFWRAPSWAEIAAREQAADVSSARSRLN